MFEIEPESFQGVAEVIMDDFSQIRDFKYIYYRILTTSEHFVMHCKARSGEVSDWIKAALISNMPDSFLHAFQFYPASIFNMHPKIWTKFDVPKSVYPEVLQELIFLLTTCL